MMRSLIGTYGFHVVIIAIFIITGVLFYSMHSGIKELQLIAASRSEKIDDLEYRCRELEQNILLGLRVNDETDIVAMKVVLDRETSGPFLVLRVHEHDCNDCVNSSLAVLENFKNVLKCQVIVIANYPAIESVKRDFPDIQYPIILADTIPLDIEGVSKPYYFLLENERISNLYFPNYRMMHLFRKYLESLPETVFTP
jgi:hypothetical protein